MCAFLKSNFKKLDVKAKFLANSFSSGSHASYIKDALIDFDTSRQYQPGDKRLDSKASLKSNVTMAKVFNPEKLINYYILLDLSASCYTNKDSIYSLALFLNYIAESYYDNIGIIGYTDKILFEIESGQEYGSVRSVLEKSYNEQYSGISNIDFIDKISETNTIFFVLSDFNYNFSKLKHLYPNKVVTVLFYSLEDWDIQNNMDIIDAETGSALHIKSQDLSIHYMKETMSICNKMRSCKCHPIITGNNYINLVSNYLIRGN